MDRENLYLFYPYIFEIDRSTKMVKVRDLNLQDLGISFHAPNPGTWVFSEDLILENPTKNQILSVIDSLIKNGNRPV